MERIHAFIELLAKVLEICGVAIILLGVVLATGAYLRQGLSGADWRGGYERYMQKYMGV